MTDFLSFSFILQWVTYSPLWLYTSVLVWKLVMLLLMFAWPNFAWEDNEITWNLCNENSHVYFVLLFIFSDSLATLSLPKAPPSIAVIFQHLFSQLFLFSIPMKNEIQGRLNPNIVHANIALRPNNLLFRATKCSALCLWQRLNFGLKSWI